MFSLSRLTISSVLLLDILRPFQGDAIKIAGLKASFLLEQLLLAKISPSTRDVTASHGLRETPQLARRGVFAFGRVPIISLLPSELLDIGVEFKRHFLCSLRGIVFLLLQNIKILVTVTKIQRI